MKKILFGAITLLFSATGALFGQHSQSLSFVGSHDWTPGSTVSLDAYLTFSGYSSLGLSYWVEVPSAIAPFLSITDVQHFTFPGPSPIITIPFNSTVGARAGYKCETADLGASVNDPSMKMVPPGMYHVTTLIFAIDPAAPLQSFTLFSTSNGPRISEVTDTDFNDNNLVPPGQFTVNIVPEPGTLALIGFTTASAVGLMWRRKMK